MAVFDYGELVGFEELTRNFILNLNKEEYFEKNGHYNNQDIINLNNDIKVRNFSLVSNSNNTEVFFFSLQLIEDFRLIM